MENNMQINKPDTFGEPAAIGKQMTVINLLADAPAANPDRPRPGVSRLLQGDGANLIAFNFLPGQDLPDHKAAHPITVQALSGELYFECEGKRVILEPGVVVHLQAYVPHAVSCPPTASGPAVMLLTMLTGEKHS